MKNFAPKTDSEDLIDKAYADTKQASNANLTSISALTDPNADRILFWDDSAGAWAWLVPSTGVVITGTNMTVRSASASATGIVELATDAETTTGTDTARAITPANLTSQIGSRIQAYDADLTTWASKTAPSGEVVGTSDTQELSGKTLVTPRIATIKDSSGNDVVSFSSPSAGTSTITAAQTTNLNLVATNLKHNGVAVATVPTVTAWTPTLNNMSGATLNYGNYIDFGNTVKCEAAYTLTGANISGAVSVQLPFTAIDTNSIHGMVIASDAGVSAYWGMALGTSTSVATLYIGRASSTYVQMNETVSTTVPVGTNMGSSDQLRFWIEFIKA